MEVRQAVVALCMLAAVAVLAVSLFPGLLVGDPGPYNETSVTVVDDNGTTLATVDVRVADTEAKRYQGLRDAESLPDGAGMLFVHGSDGEKSYVMPPEMSVALDIVFVAPDGTIRSIQHAAIPEGDDTLHYPGRGKYVLEVPRGYTNETGIDAGDRVVIPDEYAEPAE